MEAIKIIISKGSLVLERQAVETKYDYENKTFLAQAWNSHLLADAFNKFIEFIAEEKLTHANSLIPEKEVKSVFMTIRLSSAEKSKLVISSEAEGSPLNEFSRNKLLEFYLYMDTILDLSQPTPCIPLLVGFRSFSSEYTVSISWIPRSPWPGNLRLAYCHTE